MTTRTAIVTGANSGLGLECARAILASDPSWQVVLAVRDPARGADAVADLGSEIRCTVIQVDLASLDSVRGFADALRAASLPPVHAVVCNAGVQIVSGAQTTRDGYELTFGVNHLGHFALVSGLLESLVRPARVVVVSSGTHDPSKFTGMPHPHFTAAAELAKPPAGEDALSPAAGRRRYTTSKLCNVLFAYELDRRLGHGAQDITVTAYDPGLMPGSGLSRDYRSLQRWVWNHVFPALTILPGVRSTRTSGRYLAALATSPRFEGLTGAYFAGRKEIRSSTDSYDTEKARDLWTTSERLLATAPR